MTKLRYRQIMFFEQIDEINILIKFGLTVTQAKVYLALVAMGTSTVREIVKYSKIASPEVYRATSILQDKGLIGKEISIPVKFKPLPIIDSIQHLAKQRENEIIRLNQEADFLAHELDKRAKQIDLTKFSEFVLIPSGKALSNKENALITESKHSIQIIMPLDRILAWFTKKRISKFNKKLSIEIVTQRPNNPKIKEYIRKLEKADNFEVRFLSVPISVDFKIFDNNQVILSTTTKTHNPNVVWSDNDNLVKLTQNYFDGAWHSAIESSGYVFKPSSKQFDYIFSSINQ